MDLAGAHVAQPWILEPSPGNAAALLGQVLASLGTERLTARRMAPVVRQAFPWDAAAQSLEQLAEVGRSMRRNPMKSEAVVVLPAQVPAAVGRPVATVGS